MEEGEKVEGEKKVEEPMWKKFWVESFTAGLGGGRGGQWVQWEQSYDGGVEFWRGWVGLGQRAVAWAGRGCLICALSGDCESGRK